MVKILYIANDGSGVAQYVNVAQGTTVRQLFDQKQPGRNFGDYICMVNREASQPDYVLRDQDKFSVTPSKVSGA